MKSATYSKIALLVAGVGLSLSGQAFAVVGGAEVQVANAGDPVPEATITLFQDGDKVAEGESDAAGVVRFPLEEGNYTIEVVSSERTTTSEVVIAPQVVNTYVADPGSSTVEEQDEPLPLTITPDDAKTKSGYSFAYRVENGLVTVEMSTPEGTVYLSVPEVSEEGTNTHCGVTPWPGGDTDKELQKNAREIKDYSLAVNGSSIQLTEDDRLVVPASERAHVVLSRGRQIVAGGTVRLRLVARRQAGAVAGAFQHEARSRMQTVLAGGALTFHGNFDGITVNTQIVINGEEVRVVAESTLSASVYSPAALSGVYDVTIQERGVSAQNSYRGLSLEIVADRYNLHTGESTTCHVTVSGLAGIVEPAFVALINRTPAVIALAPSNHQMVTIQPDEVATSGSAKLSRNLTGVHRGQWVITAVLLPVKLPDGQSPQQQVAPVRGSLD